MAKRKRKRSPLDEVMDAALLGGGEYEPWYCLKHGRFLFLKDKRTEERPACSTCQQPAVTPEEWDNRGSLREERILRVRKLRNHLEE